MDVDWPVPQIDARLCNGCGLCVLACPHHALALENGRAVVVHPAACQYDGQCVQVCPSDAITRRFCLIVEESDKR
ncbi:MAG: 4Fe-4S binding protein [Ardenticatenaceae bacterium]|nr:4Fe-4S binding protein [Anaerolineales bacterium]MCB8923730.1 4Fe-4S binding protein [Ardenticatenaceae bacterium]MCB9005700.1 4Fe-4S binding protein [Ardenticatenaceae bacterium]